MTTQVDRFVQYALAFEEVLASDDWQRLVPFFAPDAEHVVIGGGPQARHAVGRDAVLAGLRRGVELLDRRFDRRLPEVLAGPEERDGAVCMTWRMTLQRDGLPDFVLEGEHATVYRGDAIARIDEEISPAMTVALERFLAEHDAALRPARATVAEPIARERMEALVGAYARAKSRADVAGALACCHDDFRLETVSFGVTSHGKAETAAHLRAFFAAFPDYRVTLDELTFGAVSAACWGTAEMTMAGDVLGVAATGRHVALPIFCAFGFAGGLLASERFFFDLATLCDGIGVPIETMVAALRPLRDASPSGSSTGVPLPVGWCVRVRHPSDTAAGRARS